MSVRLVETRFSGYLKARSFEVDGQPVDVLSGPGHDVVVVTGYVPTPEGPRFVLKQGDTRPSRTLRGTPYVRAGLIAGRLDHAGVSPEETARLEVTEEVGGKVLGAPMALGSAPVPTMPTLSTEADIYCLAALSFESGARPTGDGGGMEVPELLKAEVLSADELLVRIREGAVGEACRARVGFGRAFEKLGLLDPLGHSRDREQTLGLGPVVSGLTTTASVSRPASMGLESPVRLEGARIDILEEVALGEEGVRLLSARAWHLCEGQPMGASFPVQILAVAWDEVEVIGYARGPDGVPSVALERHPSPVLEVKHALFDEVRSRAVSPRGLWQGVVGRSQPSEVDQRARDLAASAGLGAPQLLLRSEASPGQSTLGEHVYAAPSASKKALMRIDEALVRVRREGASTRTEAGLLELAHLR